MSATHSIAGKNKGRILLVFALTSTFMIAEAVTGWLTGSLALLADAGHMLTDTGALGLSLFAVWFAERPANSGKTYGYYRAEILAALTNAVVLLLLSFFIIYEAWRRFRAPVEVASLPMLIVAAMGALVNLVGMKLLHSGASDSLNVKAAYLEVLSDLLSSLGVVGAGVVMLATGWYRVDPIVSAAIGLFIVPRTWALLKQAVHVLMEGTPSHVNMTALEEAMKLVEGVRAVHDLHVWTITSGVDALSAHVTISGAVSGDSTLLSLRSTLTERFGIDHVTLQLEVESCGEDPHSPAAPR